MGAVVADTHTVLWYLSGDGRLSNRARAAPRAATEAGEPIVVPSMCIAETTYLAEKGRISVTDLDDLFAVSQPDAGFVVAPFDLSIALARRRIPRGDVPDLPDRIIAATDLQLALPLVTRDARIQASGLPVIW